MQKLFSLLLALSIITLIACGDNKPSIPLTELDLTKYDMPVQILAPEDAEIKSSDMVMIQDVTVRKDRYQIQIFGENAEYANPEKIKTEFLEAAKTQKEFTEIVKEDSDGFIVKTVWSDSISNYDFFHVKIKGDRQFRFQTYLIGYFTLDEVEWMYDAVKGK